MKTALLGYGTVGKSLHELLMKKELGIEVKYILRRNKGASCLYNGNNAKTVTGDDGKTEGACKEGEAKCRPSSYPIVTDNIDDILEDGEVECVAEALSGGSPADNYIRRTLEAGKHVVSANKAALASDFGGLTGTAEKNHVSLLFEASCGGTIPLIENLKEISSIDEITEIKGILNGTCNFVLDRMERKNIDFEEALCEAQRLGYAETDPTADICGYDLYNKALISSSVAYGGIIEKNFPLSGIENLTKEAIIKFDAMGKRIRLMMLARRAGDRYAVGVAPFAVDKDSIEGNVKENFNCASIKAEFAGELKLYGQGSGGFPTADAMARDLLLIKEKREKPLKLSGKLVYDESLITGTGYYMSGRKERGSLAELIRKAKEESDFMAFCEEECIND